MMIYNNPGDDITYTGMPIYAMKSVPHSLLSLSLFPIH